MFDFSVNAENQQPAQPATCLGRMWICGSLT